VGEQQELVLGMCRGWWSRVGVTAVVVVHQRWTSKLTGRGLLLGDCRRRSCVLPRSSRSRRSTSPQLPLKPRLRLRPQPRPPQTIA
jgi:hypothetical protein